MLRSSAVKGTARSSQFRARCADAERGTGEITVLDRRPGTHLHILRAAVAELLGDDIGDHRIRHAVRAVARGCERRQGIELGQRRAAPVHPLSSIGPADPWR